MHIKYRLNVQETNLDFTNTVFLHFQHIHSTTDILKLSLNYHIIKTKTINETQYFNVTCAIEIYMFYF